MEGKNELEKMLPIGAVAPEFNNNGNGVMIPYAGTVNIIKNADGARQFFQQMGSSFCNRMLLNSLSHEMFSIFVLEAESYASGNFSISLEDCLKHTEENIYKKYYRVDEEAIRDILHMPVILATVNQSQKQSSQWQYFYLAKIDSIEKQGKTFRFEFKTDGKCYRQQALNEHCRELGIRSVSLRTELDEVHWAIKEGNLLGLLDELGI